ncbi:MAG: hypothetical protein ACKOFI_00695 [Phycisphaerales bacterium]
MRADRCAVATATILPVSVATLTLALAATAGAAPPPAITWGSATNMSGDSDVSTSGTLKYAYNVGASGVSSVSDNGVTFAPYAFPALLSFTNTVTSGGVSFVESDGTLWSNNSQGTASGAGLSADYKSMLSSIGGATNPGTITVTLGNLASGTQYQLQVWVNNSSNGSVPNTGDPISSVILGSGANQVTLDANTTNSAGGVGQFVLGTFTASGSSQTFTLNGSGGMPVINAFQLRDLTPIPGPGGAALAAIIGAMLPAGRRRR